MDEHLKELPDELQRALGALDERAARAAAGLDAERVAGRVVARLREKPAVRVVWWSRPPVMALAASVAVVAIAGLTAREMLRREVGEATAVAALPVGEVLDTLSERQAEAILAAVSGGTLNGDVALASAVSVEDLNETELRALLQALERSEE